MHELIVLSFLDESTVAGEGSRTTCDN